MYIGKKNNLLAMTETLLLDQNVGSNELEEAKGELVAEEKAFVAAYDGLSKLQRRRAQDERNHLWLRVTNCICDLVSKVFNCR